MKNITCLYSSSTSVAFESSKAEGSMSVCSKQNASELSRNYFTVNTETLIIVGYHEALIPLS